MKYYIYAYRLPEYDYEIRFDSADLDRYCVYERFFKYVCRFSGKYPMWINSKAGSLYISADSLLQIANNFPLRF